MTEEEKAPEQTVYKVSFERLSPAALSPRLNANAVKTFDLFCAYSTTVPPKAHKVLLTDIRCLVPRGCYAVVEPRSCFAAQCLLDPTPECIERGCDRSISVTVFNLSTSPLTFRRGDLLCCVCVMRKVLNPGGKLSVFDMRR
ncbi:MAG: dUTPase protein [Psittacine adenovirus 12]